MSFSLRTEHGTIHGLFDEQAARTPDRTALRDARESLTYAETRRRADALAARLHQHCPRPGARIGLRLDRGVQTVVAMLAVLKCGHAYVPLDPAYPADRLRFMARDAAVSLVLTDRDTAAEPADVPALRLGVPLAAATRQPPEPAVDPDAPAYLLYTSGSTGQPKGVLVPHRNVLALVRACGEQYQLTGDDVWTAFHSYAFDLSVWEIWGALLSGGTLVLVPREVAASPRATLDLLIRERVTVFSVVPSVFRHLVRAAAVRVGEAPAPRYVIFGGESIDMRDIRTWRRAFGTASRFVHTYGLTEATVFATHRPLTDEELDGAAGAAGSQSLPDIGTPLDGWQLAVLDEDGEPIGPGEIGEIHVAGDGLAVGYPHRPQLTAERCTLSPLGGRPAQRYHRTGDLARMRSDGSLCYAGRVADEVRTNGPRFGLGEVESVLRRAPGVRELVVVRTLSGTGEPMTTAFYTVRSSAQVDLGRRLSAHARAELPAHMLPRRFVRLPELPIDPSGRTDRTALAAWQPPTEAVQPRPPHRPRTSGLSEVPPWLHAPVTSPTRRSVPAFRNV
ncbi:amino acid adenylation domain-containing protein [Streptantibioticus ferralitis]|uniref:Amino acid adenylation domain-containing protein n=1 Tax=Streptantibioticus ferralitis TaxID=236510 RepID=A0ABT5YY99_9ACTN|nr:amino acid adenylation domain-containing protein [Streptantibioticus ferralitis]MDF2256291.1 amino acid adenylation domain-containing protein [Streptantibioticus ferralitis]